MGRRTVGVEEELFLIDPETRRPAPRARAVVEAAGRLDDSPAATQHLEGELYRHQIETQTEPTSCLDSLRRQLVETRRLAASSSAEVGLVAIASGTIPTPYPDPLFAAQDRYLALGERFAEIARPAGTCGMHVHVGIDSPEEGVAVLDEIAMWLPLILALSVNSPFHDGRDTGYDSWRTQIWTRWPSAGPTSTFGSLEAYQAVSRVLRASGPRWTRACCTSTPDCPRTTRPSRCASATCAPTSTTRCSSPRWCGHW